jgi:hypothetical protein
MKRIGMLIAVATLATIPSVAGALTVLNPVTPDTVRQDPKAWTIKVEKTDGGMIAFTITHALKEPQYVVASLRIRKGDEAVLESHFPAFVREGSAIYYFAVAPSHVQDSSFELSVSSFAHANGQDVPLPGSLISLIRLKDFAP